MEKPKGTKCSGRTFQNRSKTGQYPIPPKILIGVIIVLMAAGIIGTLIRDFGSLSIKEEPVVQVDETDERPDLPEIPEVVKHPSLKEVFIETETEFEQEQLPHGTVRSERNAAQNNQTDNQLNTARLEDALQWISWFGELPVQDRRELMRGTMMSTLSLIQRWQNMSPEQVQEERAQLREVFQEWYNLPQEERFKGIQILQEQLEQLLYYQQGFSY